MKIQQVIQTMRITTAVIIVMALTAAMAWAESQDMVNIFENPGKKQTDMDFKPAPAKIETNFGKLEFSNGAYPDKVWFAVFRLRATSKKHGCSTISSW